MDNDGWRCSQCGACCRLVGLQKKAWDRGDLACKLLTADNRCVAYATRPFICRNDNEEAICGRTFTGEERTSLCRGLRSIAFKEDGNACNREEKWERIRRRGKGDRKSQIASCHEGEG